MRLATKFLRHVIAAGALLAAGACSISNFSVSDLNVAKLSIADLDVAGLLGASVHEKHATKRVRAAIDDRLGLMTDVAIYKSKNNLPVEDLEREAAVLARTVSRAEAAGLDSETAGRLIAAQMQAAKARQRAILSWGDTWGAVEEVPDLATVLRPKITEATDALIDAYMDSRDLFEGCKLYKVFSIPPNGYYEYGDNAWRIAIDGLFDPKLRCGAPMSGAQASSAGE